MFDFERSSKVAAFLILAALVSLMSLPVLAETKLAGATQEPAPPESTTDATVDLADESPAPSADAQAPQPPSAATVTAPEADDEEIDQGGRRIVGGEPSDISNHPWQVGLLINAGGPKPRLCGGSIIADKWIVTAAHCFKGDIKADAIKVKIGVNNLNDGTAFEIDRLVVHESYSAVAKTNDITLLRLKSRNGGAVIPLATTATSVSIGQPLEVTGWGAVDEKSKEWSPMLLKANVPLVSNDVCNEPASYAGKIKDGMMCAGHKDGGIDSCQGDSGGPLVLRSAFGPVLYGVVSWGSGCARKLKYGVYTRVADFRPWIVATMQANKY